MTGGSAGKTDVDVLLNGKAIELKLTINAATDEEIVKKCVKYWTVPQASGNLELRSLDSVEDMSAYVQGAFDKYLAMNKKQWPRWLKRAVGTDKNELRDVRNAITFTQMPSSRYNYFPGAGG